MKKKELIEIIRFAVRKELKECLPTIIKECQVKVAKKKPTPPTDPVELTKQVLRTESKVASAPKKKQTVHQYTRNELINEALNATAGGVPQEGSRVGDDNSGSDFTDLHGNSVQVEELPDTVSHALTRDYSKLMGAIDKKRGPTN